MTFYRQRADCQWIDKKGKSLIFHAVRIGTEIIIIANIRFYHNIIVFKKFQVILQGWEIDVKLRNFSIVGLFYKQRPINIVIHTIIENFFYNFQIIFHEIFLSFWGWFLCLLPFYPKTEEISSSNLE